MSAENTDSSQQPSHHIQSTLCETRPAYRQGRQLTAVKVYTVACESQHLFIYGVPKINLRTELKTLCSKYGQISKLGAVQGYETEMFTECYHVCYKDIQSARIAKRMLDNKSFYGGVLHVCYSPEYESLEETKAKLMKRKRQVMDKLKLYKEDSGVKLANDAKKRTWSDAGFSESDIG